MHYNSSLENFVDLVDFTANTPCTFIVYPAGAAGDLLSSILIKHYCNPAAEFFGITDTGQAIVRDSDYKYFNKNLKCDDVMLDHVNTHLSDKNCNLSNIDQIIFSNHGYTKESIFDILSFFKQARIIRIIAKNYTEHNIINWLHEYKNFGIIKEFVNVNTNYEVEFVNDERVLNIFFGDIINETRYEQTYDKIIKHLNLPYKLVRYDFIKFWLSKQHPNIKHLLEKI